MNKLFVKIIFPLVIILAIGLLAVSFILKAQLQALDKDNQKNLGLLNQAYPGFNTRSLGDLEQNIKELKSSILGLFLLFDAKDKWFKQDYDLSIQFVEELTNTRQFLKTKSSATNLVNPEFGFSEKLPSDTDAFYLLSQLYVLKELASLAMDYSINLKLATPQAIEEQSPLAGVKLIKSRIELSCQPSRFIDFIIQLSELTPRPILDSILLKSEDNSLDATITLSNILEDKTLDMKAAGISPASITQVSQLEYIRILRSNNTFLLPKTEETLQPEVTLEPTTAQKPLVRFIYRGKALLKNKEVVVIEDALNQETLFVSKGDKIDGFILDDFSSDQIILKDIDSSKETIIKREEP